MYLWLLPDLLYNYVSRNQLTQCCHGVHTLLHLLRHHTTHAHQALCDVTGGLGQILLGLLPGKEREEELNSITSYVPVLFH